MWTCIRSLCHCHSSVLEINLLLHSLTLSMIVFMHTFFMTSKIIKCHHRALNFQAKLTMFHALHPLSMKEGSLCSHTSLTGSPCCHLCIFFVYIRSRKAAVTCRLFENVSLTKSNLFNTTFKMFLHSSWHDICTPGCAAPDITWKFTPLFVFLIAKVVIF